MNNTRLTIIVAVDGLLALIAWALTTFAGVQLSLEAGLGAAAVLQISLLAVLPEDVYQRILRRSTNGAPPAAPLIVLLALGLLFALPSPAHATKLAVGLRCEEGQAWTSSVSSGCLHHDLEIDVLLGAQVVGVQITGELGRIVSAGDASLGIKFAYKPKAFAMPEAVGLFVIVAGNLIDVAGAVRDADLESMVPAIKGAFRGFLVAGLTALGFWYGGLGALLEIDDGVADWNAFVSSGFFLPI